MIANKNKKCGISVNNQANYGYVYIITNLQTKKVYIGQTTQIKNKNYFCGGDIIKSSIKKHGKKFFNRRILGFCSTKEELDNCEKECISFLNSQDSRYGYNIQKGGEGGAKGLKRTEATRKRISEANRRRTMSEETKQKLRDINLGKKHSEETKAKMSAATKGRNNRNGIKLSDETKQKLSEIHKGRKFTDEHKLKLSLSHKGIKYNRKKHE